MFLIQKPRPVLEPTSLPTQWLPERDIDYSSPSSIDVTNKWIYTPNPSIRSDLYSAPNNVRVIKSRRIRWIGHVARMGEET